MRPNLSVNQKPIGLNERLAIIYSISDLGEYIVEIIYGDKKYFIGTEDLPRRFNNLEEARAAARKNQADLAFLALSKVYQEVEADKTGSVKDETEKYDYLPVNL